MISKVTFLIQIFAKLDVQSSSIGFLNDFMRIYFDIVTEYCYKLNIINITISNYT